MAGIKRTASEADIASSRTSVRRSSSPPPADPKVPPSRYKAGQFIYIKGLTATLRGGGYEIVAFRYHDDWEYQVEHIGKLGLNARLTVRDRDIAVPRYEGGQRLMIIIAELDSKLEVLVWHHEFVNDEIRYKLDMRCVKTFEVVAHGSYTFANKAHSATVQATGSVARPRYEMNFGCVLVSETDLDASTKCDSRD